MTGPSGESTFGRASILAVDDTPANLIALEAIIGSLGHELVCVTSGAAALEVASRRDFAVILLDVMMPEMDGFQTLTKLRQFERMKNTPVIFLTAKSLDARDAERAYALGAVDYINKPLVPEVLRRKVDAFIAASQRDAEIQLQAASLRAKDREMAVLAHDVRNPLSVIAAAAALLSRHDDPQIQASAARITRAAKRIQGLAEDLLEHARTTAAKGEVHDAPMDLSVLCEALLDDFASTYPEVRFERSLPESLSGVWDEARLHQALSNLLTNAVKHGQGWVSLSASASHNMARITVTNECPPLTEEALERLFMPFARGKQGRDGVGLGLSIVREIAQAHRGRAYATWADGRVQFCLDVPLRLARTSLSSAAESGVADTLVRPVRDAG
jgi:signal transduction histidine kinase